MGSEDHRLTSEATDDARQATPQGADRGPRPIGVAGAVVFLLTAPIYLATMCRTVGFIDRGEMAAVASTLGIAHPTGYPTLTLIGHLATRFWPANPILALNALAALLVASGAAAMVWMIEAVFIALADSSLAAGIERGGEFGDVPRAAGSAPVNARGGEFGEIPRAVCSALVALLIATTQIWWQQANGFEAYALQALLLPLVLFLYLRWSTSLRRRRVATPNAAMDRGLPVGHAFAFTLGLAFTSHLTTVLLGPALLVHFLITVGVSAAALVLLLRLTPAFLLGLLPYAWLPWRAAMHPRFDWGDPQTLDRFVAHVSGRQYQSWMLSVKEAVPQQLGYFFGRLPGDLAWVGLALALLGLGWLLRRHRALGVLAVLLLVVDLAFASSYRMREIDAYFLNAYLALAMGLAAGIACLARFVRPRLIASVLGVLVVANGALHARSCDESGNHLAEDLARNLLEPLPRNAVLFTTQWDYCLAPSYYLQEVAGVRRDVLVVSPEMSENTWYLDELKRRDPEFAGRVSFEMAGFLSAVAPCETGGSCDPQRVLASHRAMLAAMMDGGRTSRPVFVTHEVEAPDGVARGRVPLGLASQLTDDSSYVAWDCAESWRWRPWSNRVDHFVATTSWIYGRALVERMSYELRHGRGDRAESCRRTALLFDPHFTVRDLPPLAYEGRELAAQSLAFFEKLRGLDARVAARR
jgi:hypothetical protein